MYGDREVSCPTQPKKPAHLAVETHLARIAQHRLLADIADVEQRLCAEQVRTWFREVFLRP